MTSDVYHIGNIIEVQRRRHKFKTNEYRTSGSIPIIDQSTDFIAGFTDEVDRAYDGELPVIVFGDHTCCLKFIDFRFAVGADGTQLLRPIEGTDARYLYYALRSVELKQFGYQRHFKLLKDCEVRVPPIQVQQRIASILGAYDDLIEVNLRRIAVLEEIAQRGFEELIQKSKLRQHGDVPLSKSVLKSLGGDWGMEEPDGDHTVEVRVIRGTDFSRLLSGDFSSCPIRFIKQSSAEKRLLKPYDVILENSINAKTRSSGSTLVVTPGLIEALNGNVIAASFCRVFQFGRPEDAVVFHMWCRHLRDSGEIDRYQIVATNGIANFQTTQFLRDCALPFQPADYQRQVEFLVHSVSSVYSQLIAKLTASRDLLLPRLISGQLSVGEAERELEEAA